jgi:hypothetical protein
MQEYLDSIKAEILANPVLAACRNSEELENHCDIYNLGDIDNRNFPSEAIKQDYINSAFNLLDDWFDDLHASKEKNMHPLFMYFDYALPLIDGFKDSSWRNDFCPSLENEQLGLKLFCDYADKSKRECGGDKFILYRLDDGASIDETIASSEDLNVILEAINDLTKGVK